MEAAANNLRTDLPTDHSLDCSGDLCPMPIYKASQALHRMQPGETIQIRCTDPGAVHDFPAFANQTHHELLRIEEPQDGVQVIFLRKGGAP